MITWIATRFLTLPPWAIKFIELLVLLVALAGAIWWGYNAVEKRGYDRAKAERKKEDDAALIAAQDKALKDQQELSGKFMKAQVERFKEKRDAQNTIDDLRHRVQSGATVLRLPAGSAVCGAAAGTGATAGSGLVGEVGSIQLMPGTADTFVSIAGRIAAGVRRENDLIDAYNTCREAANAK
jgi:cbb3-type cytochrome oxidase subunit 3